MKQTITKAISGILDYFFSLFHLIGDCFHFKWTPEGKQENVLGILKAALVIVPIIVSVVCCCMYYTNHPFIPAGSSLFGFEAIKNFYIIDGIAGGSLLIACVVFLVLIKRGPDFAITLKLLLFNYIFMPVIIFCITNLYMLIVLIVLIIIIVILSKLLINGNQSDKKTREKAKKGKQISVKETEGYMPPTLNNQPYTQNKNGNKFRVKNAHRVKVYVAPGGEMMVATNSFGEPSVDLGPERDFRSGHLSLYDENDNLIETRKIRHIK